MSVTPAASRPRPPSSSGSRPPAPGGDRVAPHNIDAEQGLLASCLLENGGDILNDCLAMKLRAEYFYRPPHQIIFEALVALYNAGMPPDEILLANKLKDAGQLEAVRDFVKK